MSDPATDLEWSPPGDGVWWLTREHFPQPMSRLMFDLLPASTEGWDRGAARLGLPDGSARWGAANGWVYYSPGEADPASYPDLERTAAETLSTRRWQSDARDWFERRRGEVVAENRARQAVDLAALDDGALADRIAGDVTHFRSVAPIHFEHSLLQLTLGWLAEAAEGWGLDRGRLVDALRGASSASTAAREHLAEIAAAVGANGVAAGDVDSIDDVRGAGSDAEAALERYLLDYGWRLLHGNELADPALVERPAVTVAGVRALLAGATGEDTGGSGGGGAAGAAGATVGAELRAAVPEDERSRFDELMADARASYRLGDDDGGICWTWPLGLLRRSVLEAGRRLHVQGRIDAVDDLFEADPHEIDDLLRADSGAPAAHELAARAARRASAALVDPPGQLGEMESAEATAPPPLPGATAELARAQQAYFALARWGAPTGTVELQGTGVGATAVTGRAFVLGADGDVGDIEPGDILVAVSTTSSLNSVFPVLGGVVVDAGGPLCHAAVLARELGLPAVVGASGATRAIRTGDTIEVDPATGTVHIR